MWQNQNEVEYKKREHIVKPGVFIPQTNINYPQKPDEYILQPKIIYPVKVDSNYPYLDKSFKGRLLNFAVYTGIFTFVFIIHKIRYGLKIEGKKNLRAAKKYCKNGALTVCNHVYRWDFLAVVQAVRKKMWFISRTENVMTSDRNFVRGAGGIPLPEGSSGIRQYNQAFDELHSKKKWIHIFPESCRWDYYEPIRPFKIGAFKMAYRYQIPVIPCVLTYREAKGIYKIFKVKHPLITIHIGKAILPYAKDGERKNDVCQRMRKEAHSQMVKMAGILQNCWEAQGD